MATPPEPPTRRQAAAAGRRHVSRSEGLLGAISVCERFLCSVRRECLDHVLVLGEQHLLEMLVEYCRYFNEARTHQSLGQLVPLGCSTAAAGSSAVIARPVLNGLHHDDRRAA
jgi:putative transposase